jgi:hypothetical protein
MDAAPADGDLNAAIASSKKKKKSGGAGRR